MAIRVTYDNKSQELKEDFSNAPELLCSKHKDWEYEAEWRIVGELNVATPIMECDQSKLALPLRAQDVCEVLFGVATEPRLRDDVFEWLKSKPSQILVNVGTIWIDPDTHELKIP